MSIELKPFSNEAEVAVADGGLILTLTIDFGVIDRLEGLLGKPMDDCISELFRSAAMQGKFLWAMTRKHHADITLDQVAGIQFSKDGPAVMATLGDLIRRTFNFGEEEGEQSSRPPKRSSGASRSSARSGSPRASRPTPSGRKRLARS
jgi:hypothetical protein